MQKEKKVHEHEACSTHSCDAGDMCQTSSVQNLSQWICYLFLGKHDKHEFDKNIVHFIRKKKNTWNCSTERETET